MLASEDQRRKVDLLYDRTPSKHHLYNFSLSKKYIKGKKVLDIGCWTGQIETLSVKIAKKMIGIDPNDFAIIQAKKLVPKAQFKTASALSLPFRENSFDTVLFFEVIEHLPDNSESKVLSEINRVLKPDGYLIMSTPNNNFFSIILDPAYFLIGHRHYSIINLIDMLTDNGFKTLGSHVTGGILFLFKSILESISKHLFRKKLVLPDWYMEKLDKEYAHGGIASIHIIAQKISPPKMSS